MRTKKQEVDSAGSPFNTASVPLPSCRKVPTWTQGTYSDQADSRRLLEESGKISTNISTIREWRFWASARLCRQDGKEGSECHSTISKVFQLIILVIVLELWTVLELSTSFWQVSISWDDVSSQNQSWVIQMHLWGALFVLFWRRFAQTWNYCEMYFCWKRFAEICKNCDCTEKHAKKSWQDRNMVQKNFPQKKFGQGHFEMKEICGNNSLIWSNKKI